MLSVRTMRSPLTEAVTSAMPLLLIALSTSSIVLAPVRSITAAVPLRSVSLDFSRCESGSAVYIAKAQRCIDAVAEPESKHTHAQCGTGRFITGAYELLSLGFA